MEKQKSKLTLPLLLSFILIVMAGSLYYYMHFARDVWTITQYGPRETNSTFYTLHNPQKGLIVIDGGWTEDEEYVRDVIASLGNHVDAWIITHPHPDHVGAFNAIYTNLGKIEIDRIITTQLPSPEVCYSVASWDNMDAYNDFLNLNIPNLEYVYITESFTLCDLQFDILNAFDEHIEVYSRDYLNDSSIMFKVTNKEESMLFCSDVGAGISFYLLGHWQENLQADYLQMGHHGYGGLEDNFYQMVAPKVAFFDAPSYMMDDTTGQYDNPDNVALMESLGACIYSFKEGPHSVILK